MHISNNCEIGVFIFFIGLDYFTALKVVKFSYIGFASLFMKYLKIFFGPYFSIFGVNTKIYSVHLRSQFKYEKIQTRQNFEFEHFSQNKRFMNILFAHKFKQSNSQSNEPVKYVFFSEKNLSSCNKSRVISI